MLQPWIPNQTIVTPDMAAEACDFFGLDEEAAIYRSDMVKSFTFDGASFINNYLKHAVSKPTYDWITQYPARKHDLIYGVCTSAERKLQADKEFQQELVVGKVAVNSNLTILDGFLINRLTIDAAYFMIRRFGTKDPSWAPGFALKLPFRKEVK